ncbi:hypothetical protein BD414DRAFT_582147 [Trametes punicea]|nr:hypothetical protein BD414DRAFT_582147 [Trametes punicea]
MDNFDIIDLFIEPEGLAPMLSSSHDELHLFGDVPLDAEHEPTTSHFWCTIA